MEEGPKLLLSCSFSSEERSRRDCKLVNFIARGTFNRCHPSYESMSNLITRCARFFWNLERRNKYLNFQHIIFYISEVADEPIVCLRLEAKFVRKSPISRSIRRRQKHEISCLWSHSVSQST